MFIQKIPGLTEHFIYINDDMYPIAYLKKEDFSILYQKKKKIKMKIEIFLLA